MNIVFFGSSKFVIPIIEAIRKSFDLTLVVTTEKLATDPVPSYCIKSKIRYYVVTDFRDEKILQELTKAKADVGVLASFGAILPNEVLNIFPKGIINIHPSLLPKYRGPTPVQTAILNGDKKTGVTIIKLDKEVDHGPILAQVKEPILENDTSESLYDRLFRLGSSSIVSTIELYLKGEINPQEQDYSKATFTKSLAREDGYIDLKNPPKPEMLDRMIRAYYPWPSVWTSVQTTSNNQLLTTNKTLEVSGQELAVSSQKLEIRIKFLPNNLIQVEGKKPMNYRDFINGYPKIGKEILAKINLY